MERDEEELYKIMEQMMDLYEAAPDFMKEKMEPVVKFAFHMKELSDEFDKIDADIIDNCTDQLKKIDRYLVRAIIATKEITEGDK